MTNPRTQPMRPRGYGRTKREEREQLRRESKRGFWQAIGEDWTNATR